MRHEIIIYETKCRQKGKYLPGSNNILQILRAIIPMVLCDVSDVQGYWMV